MRLTVQAAACTRRAEGRRLHAVKREQPDQRQYQAVVGRTATAKSQRGAASAANTTRFMRL